LFRRTRTDGWHAFKHGWRTYLLYTRSACCHCSIHCVYPTYLPSVSHTTYLKTDKKIQTEYALPRSPPLYTPSLLPFTHLHCSPFSHGDIPARNAFTLSQVTAFGTAARHHYTMRRTPRCLPTLAFHLPGRAADQRAGIGPAIPATTHRAHTLPFKLSWTDQDRMASFSVIQTPTYLLHAGVCVPSDSPPGTRDAFLKF